MANIKAQATGLWSAGATWSGGVPPGVGDFAYANTFTITIDQDITCAALSVHAATGITAGGGFVISSIPASPGRTLNCDIGISGSGGGVGNPVLTVSGGTGIVTVNGAFWGSAVNNNNGVLLSSASVTLNVNGSFTGSTSVNNLGAVVLNANNLVVNWVGNLVVNGQNQAAIAWQAGTGCTINVTGNIVAGVSGGGSGISVTGATTVPINVTGNVSSGSGATGIVLAATTSTCVITGDLTGTAVAGITASGACTIDVTGTITAGSGAAAIDSSSSSAIIRIAGTLVVGPNNKLPIYAPKWVVKAGQSVTYKLRDDSALPTGAQVVLSNFAPTPPSSADVRSGVQFGPYATATVAQVQKANGTGSSPATATYGTTPVSGNLLISTYASPNNSPATLTIPSGWTLISVNDTANNANGSLGVRTTAMAWKIAGASEPTAVAWASSSAFAVVEIYEYSSICGWPTTPLDDYITSRNAGSVTSLALGAVASSFNNEVIIGVVAINIAATSPSFSGGLTVDSGVQLGVSGSLINSTGTVTPIASTASWTSAGTVSGILASFRPNVLGTITGTMVVPASDDVFLGVPVDNTTGTALITADPWEIPL